MEKTAIQRRIEQVVTNGRGYDPNNLHNDTNHYFARRSRSGLNLALVNMDFRDEKANQSDVDVQVETIQNYHQEIMDTAMHGKIGTIDGSLREIMAQC